MDIVTTAAPLRKKRLSLENLWLLFWVAFAVRVLTITFGHTYHIRIAQDHFQFGWEMGRVARALATGHGYADPFVGHTGPTAWVPPLYPLLLAAVFKLCGVYTALSAWVILTINSIFSAATAPLIYRIAARCYNRRVAVWSAWLWVLYPAFLQYAVHWVWEMALTAFLFSCVLLLALKMRGIQAEHPEAARQTTAQWLIFGLLWGLIALSNSTLLIFLPVCGLWILRGAPSLARGVRDAVLAALLFAAILAPWTIRNYQVFHTFVPLRDNLGAELEAGSGPGSNGFPTVATLPLVARAPRTMRYKSLGEVHYVHLQGAKAKRYIAAHPAHYAAISLKRFYFFWMSVPHPVNRSALNEFFRELNYCFFSVTGVLGLLLSLKRRAPAAGLFAWAFVLLPLPYYFITVNARFRHPIEPLIAIFTVYLFQSAESRRRKAARRGQERITA